MKTKPVMWGVVFILLVLVVWAGYSREERELIRECKYDCRETKNNIYDQCKEDYNICKDECYDFSENCFLGIEGFQETCEDECINEIDDNLTEREHSRAIRSCERNCRKEFRALQKECKVSTCKRKCSTVRRTCTRTASTDYRSCSKNCVYTAFNDNITCDGIPAGTVYAEDCNRCECEYSGEIKCEETDTCFFESYDVDNCPDYYESVCKGPYFRLRCSRYEYCQCEGDYNYTCPENHACVKDFKIKIPPSPEGYKNKRGQPLGDIGVCAKRPDIETCGDGICQNEIRFSETIYTCPEDCTT